MEQDKPTPARTPAELLATLAVAAWGVCWGLLLALTVVVTHIAITGDTQDQTHPDILNSQSMAAFVTVPWQERYERMWYAVLCVGGALCGWAAVKYVRPSPLMAAVAAIAFVPTVIPACASTFSVNPDAEQVLLCVGLLAIPLLSLLWRTRSVSDGVIVTPPLTEANPSSKRMWILTGVLCLPLIALLYGLLAPYDLTAMAGEYYTESHVASYLVAPALYYRAPGTVPGLDFESHYGIGHAYAFSCVMGSNGFQSILERFVLFVLVVSIAYFLSAYLVLTDWLRNPWAALVVTLLLVGAVFEGCSYRYPSNWPVRHPFVFAFLFCAVRGVENKRWGLTSGAVAGLSLFWQTDIGIYTLAAGFAFYVANALFLGGSAWRIGTFLAGSFGTFMTICFVLFGPRVLSVEFCQRLLEPLLLYGTGFGNQLLNWQSMWGYWYNVIGPGLAVASVAAWIGCRRGVTPTRATLYAAVASLLGLAMLIKWVNRSIDVVWALNGGLVLAVAGCWACILWQVIAKQLASEKRPLLGFARQSAVLAGFLWLAVLGAREDRREASPKYQGGSSSPLVRVFDRLDLTENPINAVRKKLVAKQPTKHLDTDTITFLRANTSKTERVAVLAPHDWGYLAAAGRAPKLHWVQLFLVHSPVLLDRCCDDIRTSDRVFVHCDALISLSKVNPTAYEHVSRALDDNFGPPEWTPCQWQLYHRKPGQLAQR